MMKSIIIYAVLVATLFIMNGASGDPVAKKGKGKGGTSFGIQLPGGMGGFNFGTGGRQKRDVSDNLRDVGENVGETLENIGEHLGNGWQDLVKAWNEIGRTKREAE